MQALRSPLRALSWSLLVAGSAACASGAAGGRSAGGERLFSDWESFFAYHVPRLEVRGSCVLSLGRGVTSLRRPSPPVVEVDGHAYLDGCIPPEIRPGDMESPRVLTASQASAAQGSLGANGVVRLRTKG